MTVEMCSKAIESCPACQSDVFETIGREAGAFRCDGKADQYHPAYSVRCCRRCALYYKSHVLTGGQLGVYYAGFDFAPFNGDFGFPTDNGLLLRLRNRTVGSRVLDFGCSTGRILQALGPTYERFGVEINAAAAAEATSRGITIVSEEDVSAGRVGFFDVIVLADVFEHLITPTETTRMLADRLAPGGEILIVTGLADAVSPRELIAEHWYMRIPGHLQMISLAHIKWVAKALGLGVDEVQTMSHYRIQPMRRIRQEVQAAVYATLQLSPHSSMASLIKGAPGLARAARWTNLPATDQRADHVLTALVKTKRDASL